MNDLIRRAEVTDAHDLARLRAASLLEQRLLDPACASEFERGAEASFASGLRDGRVVAWLLAEGNGVVGCASVVFWERLPYAETALHAELAGVYVAPRCRGRGFARALCRQAIDAARARGARRISVHPSLYAGRLYRDLGFVDGNQLRLA